MCLVNNNNTYYDNINNLISGATVCQTDQVDCTTQTSGRRVGQLQLEVVKLEEDDELVLPSGVGRTRHRRNEARTNLNVSRSSGSHVFPHKMHKDKHSWDSCRCDSEPDIRVTADCQLLGAVDINTHGSDGRTFHTASVL